MSGLGVEARDIGLAHGDERLSVVSVRTLSHRPAGRNPYGVLVEVAPLDFSDPDGLCRSMEGAGVLYKTYGCCTHGAGPPSTSRSRTLGRCSRSLRGRALAG